jgi:DNA-binding transcriptional LysR family regulator
MSLADELVEQAGPWLTPDLETYLRAAGSMLAEVEEFAFDTEDAPGSGSRTTRTAAAAPSSRS